MSKLSVNTGFYATVKTGLHINYNPVMEYKDYADRLQNVLGFLTNIKRIGRFDLHPVRELKRLDACFQFRFVGARPLMQAVLPLQ